METLKNAHRLVDIVKGLLGRTHAVYLVDQGKWIVDLGGLVAAPGTAMGLTGDPVELCKTWPDGLDAGIMQAGMIQGVVGAAFNYDLGASVERDGDHWVASKTGLMDRTPLLRIPVHHDDDPEQPEPWRDNPDQFTLFETPDRG